MPAIPKNPAAGFALEDVTAGTHGSLGESSDQGTQRDEPVQASPGVPPFRLPPGSEDLEEDDDRA